MNQSVKEASAGEILERSGPATAAILREAATLFSERGFSGVALSAIAEAAGVSKGNIFHHFGSKELLYVAVIRDACSHTGQLLNEISTGTGNLAERIRRFMRAHLRHLMDNPCESRLIQREILRGDTAMARTLVEHVLGENYTKLVSILKNGQAQGEIRADLDPAALALGLVAGNVFYFQVQSLLPFLPDTGGISDPNRFSDAMSAVFLDGVLTAAGRMHGD